MNKCPSCGADTRPGDNFCLTCGNRLFTTDSSPQQMPFMGGDATIPAQDNWGTPTNMATIPGSAPASWSANNDQTIANTMSEAPTVRADASDAQPAMNKIENPARFVVHPPNSDAVQEYTLDKKVMVIGRVPESDICFPEDKLVSRTHATVRYENGDYVLRDEGSANGTFVNSQELAKMSDWVLHDGDKIIIGDHELAFRASTPAAPGIIEEGETIIISIDSSVVGGAVQVDEDATLVGDDPLGTRTMEVGGQPADSLFTSSPAISETGVESPPAAYGDTPAQSSEAQMHEVLAPATPPPPPSMIAGTGVTMNSFSSISQPTLPDMGSLLAASAALDGQIASFQQQLNDSYEATRQHEAEIVHTVNQLRTALSRLAERMDSTIAGVARSREEQDWDGLLRLIQDTISNPRDIGNAMEFARRAVDVDKAFQRYQGVLNTLAECNSLLRNLIGEEKPQR
jgi:pSer/pThr/pTyr-binding forkhead associated (FHA) protein